jgi:predicted hotdog family 3-hydroxylacyl-ACP dehydratase
VAADENAFERYIEELAQKPPFRFVDRIVHLDESSVVTELHGWEMPGRFADAQQVEMYVVLELAAQSSGLVLRDRKKAGARGVIASFRDVERTADRELTYPLRLASRLVDERWTMFGFDFEVYSGEGLAMVGNVGIFIGR